MNIFSYPYDVSTNFQENNSTFDLTAHVSYQRKRTVERRIDSGRDKENHFLISWVNAMDSRAEYNRTLNHSHINVAANNATERFTVNSRVGREINDGCFNRHLAAKNGLITRDTGKNGIDNCPMPTDYRFCGSELCTAPAKASRNRRAIHSSHHSPTRKARNGDVSSNASKETDIRHDINMHVGRCPLHQF